jgi:CRP/FNR family transcriptional regulator, cyclic AMP receptor protein
MKSDNFTAPDFLPVDDSAISQLARMGRVQQFAPHTIVLIEGDFSDGVFVILQGHVKAFVSEPDGGEIVLSVLGPGECFGEMMLDGGPRVASVITLENVCCSVISRAALRAAIAGDPACALWMIELLIARNRVATSLIKNLALRDVYQRVTHLLQGMTQESSGESVVSERLTQQEIANRVGASRDMVSRVIKELTAGGYITREHKTITLIKKFPLRW